MFIHKFLVPFFVLYFVCGCRSKPTESDLTKGRGIGSTIWGWITYPFSWWNSDVTEQAPQKEPLIGSTTIGPYDNREVGKRNITVWCNDQTCTTMTCDRKGCRNVTCNIYDTDMNGECREYNTLVKPEEPMQPVSTRATVKPDIDKIIEISSKDPETTTVKPIQTTQTADIEETEEHPLELEAVLSSTVTGGHENNAEKS